MKQPVPQSPPLPPPMPRRRLEFFVQGVSKTTVTGAVGRFGKRLIPMRKGSAWSAVVGMSAREHALPSMPWQGPVGITLRFLVRTPKKPKNPYAITRPDAENLGKGLLDSFNGVLYDDDSQVVQYLVIKEYCERSARAGLPELRGKIGVHVRIERME